MAVEISHTPRIPSIPTTLQDANERIRQLEAENSRLRFALRGIQNQIASLEPGKYILLDDGDFGGPYSGNIDHMVRDFTGEGTSCMVIGYTWRVTRSSSSAQRGAHSGIAGKGGWPNETPCCLVAADAPLHVAPVFGPDVVSGLDPVIKAKAPSRLQPGRGLIL